MELRQQAKWKVHASRLAYWMLGLGVEFIRYLGKLVVQIADQPEHRDHLVRALEHRFTAEAFQQQIGKDSVAELRDLRRVLISSRGRNDMYSRRARKLGQGLAVFEPAKSNQRRARFTRVHHQHDLL